LCVGKGKKRGGVGVGGVGWGCVIDWLGFGRGGCRPRVSLARGVEFRGGGAVGPWFCEESLFGGGGGWAIESDLFRGGWGGFWCSGSFVVVGGLWCGCRRVWGGVLGVGGGG